MKSSQRTSSCSGAANSSALFVGLLGLVVALGLAAWWTVSRDDADPHTPTAAKPQVPADAPIGDPATVSREAPPVEAEPTRWTEKIEGLDRIPVRNARGDVINEVATEPLHGRVLNADDDEPVYYFWLYLIPIDAGDPEVAKATCSPTRCRNGEFTLRYQQVGTFNLIVESREHEPVTRQIEVPFDGELVVRLKRGNSIQGIVRDHLGTPFGDLTVTIVPGQLDGDVLPPIGRMTTTDGMGRYAFWKLPPGNYALQVSISGDRLVEEPEFRLLPGAAILRDFALDRMGSLRVVVSNIASQPIPKATASLVQEIDGRERVIRTAQSDLKGIARLDFVRDGSYKLRIRMAGFTTFEVPLGVAASEGFREVPIQLQVAPPTDR